MLRPCAALALAFVVAACQVEITPPAPTPQPGPKPTVSQMRDTCVRTAGQQGYRTSNISNFVPVTGSRGREIGAAATMRVVRNARASNIRCNYSYGDRMARLTPLDGAPPPPQPQPQPGLAELRTQCTRAAQAQDLGVLNIGDFRKVTGSRGIEIGATAPMTVVRNSRVFDVRCNYSFADRQVRLTEV